MVIVLCKCLWRNPWEQRDLNWAVRDTHCMWKQKLLQTAKENNPKLNGKAFPLSRSSRDPGKKRRRRMMLRTRPRPAAAGAVGDGPPGASQERGPGARLCPPAAASPAAPSSSPSFLPLSSRRRPPPAPLFVSLPPHSPSSSPHSPPRHLLSPVPQGAGGERGRRCPPCLVSPPFLAGNPPRPRCLLCTARLPGRRGEGLAELPQGRDARADPARRGLSHPCCPHGRDAEEGPSPLGAAPRAADPTQLVSLTSGSS